MTKDGFDFLQGSETVYAHDIWLFNHYIYLYALPDLQTVFWKLFGDTIANIFLEAWIYSKVPNFFFFL